MSRRITETTYVYLVSWFFDRIQYRGGKYFHRCKVCSQTFANARLAKDHFRKEHEYVLKMSVPFGAVRVIYPKPVSRHYDKTMTVIRRNRDYILRAIGRDDLVGKLP